MSTSPQLQLVAPRTEQWISGDEFMRRAGWSAGWLRAQTRIGKVSSRETGSNGRNGKPERVYAVTSLPADAHAAWLAEQAQLAVQAPAAMPLFSHMAVAAPATPRLALTAAAEHEMQQRLNTLQPLLDYRADPSRFRNLRLPGGAPIRSLTDMVAFVAAQRANAGTPVSEATLWRWLKQHRTGGDGGLIKRPRKDANGSRWFAEHPKAAYLVASVRLGDGFVPGASVRGCLRSLEQQRELLDLAAGDMPSYDTVRRFVEKAPRPLATLAREGRKKFGELHLPYVRRSYAECANEIWVSDHCIADVEVLNDCFTDLPYGAPMRMRLTAIVDWRSRYIVAHTWCVEGSSVSLAAAMAQAVRRHGPCEIFYCDNGKDYVKFAKGATPGYLRSRGPEGWAVAELDANAGMLARLGIHVNHAIPHHPQAKPIERLFGTVHAQFCASFQTYTAGLPSLRPDSTAALMAIHRKLLRAGQVEQSLHPTATRLAALFEVWMEEYHNTPHTGEGMQSRTPAQVFLQERNPRQKPTPPLDQIILAGMERAKRLVRETAIHLFDTRYVPADDAASARLFLLNGREVHIAYDRLDPEYIAVLNDSGFVLCMLRVEALLRMAPDDPNTQAQIAASMQQRGMLKRLTTGLHDEITRGRRAIGAKAPVELMAAKLPAATVAKVPNVTQRPVPPQRLRTLAAHQAAPKHAASIAQNFLASLSEEIG